MDTNTVHLILETGSGHSLCAVLLAQYLMHCGVPVTCYDTDPVNDTFSQYRALPVQRIDLPGPDQHINAREFDRLIEALVWDDGVAIVDHGTSTVEPLMAYLVENQALAVLRDAGRPVLLHWVLTGSQVIDNTLLGLDAVLTTQQAPVIVWIDDYFVSVREGTRAFPVTRPHTCSADRIVGTVHLERAKAATFREEFELMLQRKLTFTEALDSTHYRITPRQRLAMTRDAIFHQLAAIGL